MQGILNKIINRLLGRIAKARHEEGSALEKEHLGQVYIFVLFCFTQRVTHPHEEEHSRKLQTCFLCFQYVHLSMTLTIQEKESFFCFSYLYFAVTFFFFFLVLFFFLTRMYNTCLGQKQVPCTEVLPSHSQLGKMLKDSLPGSPGSGLTDGKRQKFHYHYNDF